MKALCWQTEKPTEPGWWLAVFPSSVFPGGVLQVVHLERELECGSLVRRGTCVTPDKIAATRWCGPVEWPGDEASPPPVKYPEHKPNAERIE